MTHPPTDPWLTCAFARPIPIALLLLPGCSVQRTVGEASDETGDLDAMESADDLGTDGSDMDGAAADDGAITGPALEAIDILFVVDNSGSMGDEQARLIGGLEEMLDAFDARGVDVRLAFTTTDDGNVECSNTSPEGGRFRLSSCRDRADEFTWPKDNPQVEAFEAACAARCPSGVSAQLGVTPTTTADDPDARPRRWFELRDGTTNVTGGTLAQAIGCFSPQGVDGCGFESPLSAARKAIDRARMPGEPEYGFLRDEAALAVVIVSDEADCSARAQFQPRVFDRNLPDAAKVFWEDPLSPTPTSAICWNAGVRCTGPSTAYDDCVPTSFDVVGELAVDDADAVLDPVDGFVAAFEMLEAQKAATNDRARVIVSVVGGVPEGYAGGTAQVRYRDSDDQYAQLANGVDFGCTSQADGGELQTAVPPVRLRAFAEAFDLADGTRNIASICSDGFDGGLMHVVAEFDHLNAL